MTNSRALPGLAGLEPDPERQLKYLDFIDIYAALDEDEQRHVGLLRQVQHAGSAPHSLICGMKSSFS